MATAERDARDDARDEISKEQIRRRMLEIARLQGNRYEGGFVPAPNFLAARDDQGVEIESEAEAVALLDDLLGWGLLEELAGVHLGGTAKAFRHRKLRLSKKGWELRMHQIPVIPGVADERND